MRAFFTTLFGYFLSAPGLFAFAFLDSTPVIFLPLGIDVIVVIMSAREPGLFWLYALIAAGGSVAGGALTFWIGRKIGEHGLTRLVSEKKLERVRRRVKPGAAASVAALGAIPPPFPFTPFEVAAGALGLQARPFFLTLAGARILRFGAVAGFAAYFGRRILGWMESTIFEVIIGMLIVATIAGTIASVVSLVRGSRNEGA